MAYLNGINLGAINLSQGIPATPRILPYEYLTGIGYPVPYSWKPKAGDTGILLTFLSPYIPSIAEAATAADIQAATAIYPKTTTEAGTAADIPSAAVIQPATITETTNTQDSQDAVINFPVDIVEPATATETSNGVISGGGPVIYDVSVIEMAVALSHEDGLIYPHVITAFNPLSAKNATKYSPGITHKKRNRIYTSCFR